MKTRKRNDLTRERNDLTRSETTRWRNDRKLLVDWIFFFVLFRDLKFSSDPKRYRDFWETGLRAKYSKRIENFTVVCSCFLKSWINKCTERLLNVQSRSFDVLIAVTVVVV